MWHLAVLRSRLSVDKPGKLQHIFEVIYQFINPGYISWWVTMWGHVASSVGFTAQSWMSASILSFVVAAVVTLAIGGIGAMARTTRPA